MSITLNLNNVDDNGISDENKLSLSLSVNDVIKLPLKDVLKTQKLIYQNCPSGDIEDFYDILKYFKFKIKAEVPRLINFRLNKLSDLLILLRSTNEDNIITIYKSDIIRESNNIEIIANEDKIVVYK